VSYVIIWSPDAVSTFEERIDYLKLKWTEREIINFTNRVKEYLEVLKEEPLIGKRTGKRKNLHTGLIIREVSLIYRVKAITLEIELVVFFDNRQNPKKIRKYKT
jgi:plasmid stabilization system protein ParE